MRNAELDAESELPWADLEDWWTDSGVGGYLVNHQVGESIAMRADRAVAMFFERLSKCTSRGDPGVDRNSY